MAMQNYRKNSASARASKGTGSTVGAGNPAKASQLNKLKTGNPTVPHNEAHSASKKGK